MITSKDNPKIKELRKLQDKRARDKSGLFAAEGEDLVDAALDAGWQPVTVYCTEAAPRRFRLVTEALLVDDSVLADASTLGSSSRVIAVFEQRWSEPGGDLSVYLDGAGDPGNVGTAMRSALAFADGPVILGPNCADPYSPKAVRAAMGAIFRRPPARAKLGELMATKVALDGTAEQTLDELDLTAPVVIVVGAERTGLTTDALAIADVAARIPMRDAGPESLNAAMASAIALYEVSRKLQTTLHGAAAAAAAHGNTDPGQN